jgi:hypothetical protein
VCPEVPGKDRKGNPAKHLVQILSDTTISDDDTNPMGQVVYSFSKGMREIIKDSTLWGRVRSAVVFAFTSKYALALYELITTRINLKHVWQEEFAVEDFCALLGSLEEVVVARRGFHCSSSSTTDHLEPVSEHIWFPRS